MYHVKYRDSFGKLVLLEGRSAYKDAKSEAEDHVTTGHREVEILITVDANSGAAAAAPRRLPEPGRDDDGTQAETTPLR